MYIELTQNKFAIIDNEFYDTVKEYKWYAVEKHKTFYAKTGRAPYGFYLHHLILGCPLNNLEIDHINHNGLDNRLSNLRIITHRQNLSNKRNNYESDYPGVHFDNKTNKWTSAIRIDKRVINLGFYTSEFMAFYAYREKLFEIGERLLPEHELLFKVAGGISEMSR